MNKNDEKERNGFVWPVILKNPNAHANVDFYYGPYDSLDSLKEGVPNDLWVPGFTAAVQDEDGVVTEWWVQGEGASARWEQKGVRHDTYVALKGVRNSLAELEAIENPEVGDMYLVPDEGETGSFLEYVYTGDKWELLGFATTQMKGTLSVRGGATMTSADGRNAVYDGSQNVVLDLSNLAKKTDIQTISDYTLVEKGYKDNSGGVVYSLKDNNTGIDLGLRTRTNDNSAASPKPTVGVGIEASSAYIKGSSARVTAGSEVDITSSGDITINNTARKLKILLSSLGVTLRCHKFDVRLNDDEGLTLHYGGSSGSHAKRTRISPLVLYIKLEYQYSNGNIGTLDSWNPYGYTYSVTRNSEGNYTINFTNAKFRQFAMVGTGWFADHEHIYVSQVYSVAYGDSDTTLGTPPAIKFRTANDSACDDFREVCLFIYDFTTESEW